MKIKFPLTLLATLLALTLHTHTLSAHPRNTYNPENLTALIDAHNFYTAIGYMIGHQNDFEFQQNGASFEPDFQEAHAFRAALGYIVNSWRFELEYLLQRSKIKGGTTIDPMSTAENAQNDAIRGDFRQHAFMLNLYYTHALSQAFTAYIGGGLGATYQRYHRLDFEQGGLPNPTFCNSVTTLAYQFLAGLELNLSDHWALYLGYRFLITHRDVKEDSRVFLFGPERASDFPMSHNLETGIRLRF